MAAKPKPTTTPKPAERKARIAAQQAAERARESRNKLLLRVGIGVVALGVVGGVVAVVADSGSSGKSGSSDAAPTTLWKAPADAAAAVKAAGLPMLTAEGTALHIHAHLDVYVNGKKTAVPGLVGIDETHQQISPLHTHDTSGVVHIESPTVKDFTLGQFMKEWEVELSSTQLGPNHTDGTHTLTVYVNGKPTTGDPAALVLAAHAEIALVYGTASENATVTVPTSYTWTNGL